jgi:zinc protease
MRRFAVVTAALLWPLVVAGQVVPRIPVETYRLDNGLQVILSPDHSSQVVTVNIWFNAGSRNEARGRTGFAHLFEHMMFQGSANVKKGDHFALVERAGGQTNASTAEDRTNYFEMLPSNRLNLGLWLEADRMRSLAVTDSALANQREAVKEERRLRVDNQPYTAAFFEGIYALQDSTTCFPYAHSVIGSMADLNAAGTGDVKAFFDLYYAPNNATLVIAGDFDPGQAKAMVTEYFGTIPRGAKAPAVTCDARFGTGQIRKPWPDQKATLPGVFIAYRVPQYADPDYPAVVLLASILGQGESSRLNKSVVREKKLAQAAFAFLNPSAPRRGPGVFLAGTIANQNVTAETIETAVMAQIASLAKDGVTPDELDKAKNGYLANKIQQQQISYFLAEAIQEATLFLGDPNGVNTDPARYLAVTVDDIRRVAARYFVPDNSLVMLVTPAGAR